MRKYNIVDKNLKIMVLASCETLEQAKKYLKDMENTDKYLQKVYGWAKLPEYEIIESEV